MSLEDDITHVLSEFSLQMAETSKYSEIVEDRSIVSGRTHSCLITMKWDEVPHRLIASLTIEIPETSGDILTRVGFGPFNKEPDFERTHRLHSGRGIISLLQPFGLVEALRIYISGHYVSIRSGETTTKDARPTAWDRLGGE